MTKCSWCFETKDDDLFYRGKKECKECFLTKERERRSKKYSGDPEYRAALLERSAKYRAEHPDRRQAAKRLSRYGIDQETWNELYRSQGGVCRICGGVNADGRQLGVDHDADTGMIRGLLCTSCNIAIGCLKHSVVVLESAIGYLRSNASIAPKRVGRVKKCLINGCRRTGEDAGLCAVHRIAEPVTGHSVQ